MSPEDGVNPKQRFICSPEDGINPKQRFMFF